MTKPKKKEDLLKTGRPSTYKPEYCETIIGYMAKGYSLTGWCAENNTHKQIAHGWMKRHPDFYDAYKKARTLCQAYWEKLMLQTAKGEVKGNLGAQIFWMKNRFRDEWQDRVELDQNINLNETVYTVKIGESGEVDHDKQVIEAEVVKDKKLIKD